MNEFDLSIPRSQEAVRETNKVLRNTYLLLSLTLMFSAVMAAVAIAINMSQGMALVLSIMAFGMLFWVHKTADSSQGLIAIFAFTGTLGLALGPMLSYYLAMPNGGSIVMQALGGTAIVFLSLSGYALTSSKDFSFLRGFIFTGMIVAIVAMIANIFLNIPAMWLALDVVIIMLMSGFILFDTSRIIRGGETNYIRATVGLYLSIYNIFTSLLHLLGAFGDD